MSAEDDPLRAARAAKLKAIDWGSTLKRLVVKARRLGASPALAEDVASHVVLRLLQTGGANWDFAADPTGFRHLLRRMDQRIDTLREQERLRQELRPTELDTDKVDAQPPDSDRGGERELVEQEAVQRNLERLRAGLRGFPVTLALLELSAREGLLQPSVVAERLGVDVKEVYTAEAQLRRHVGRLRSDGSDPAVRRVESAEEAG